LKDALEQKKKVEIECKCVVAAHCIQLLHEMNAGLWKAYVLHCWRKQMWHEVVASNNYIAHIIEKMCITSANTFSCQLKNKLIDSFIHDNWVFNQHVYINYILLSQLSCCKAFVFFF